MKAATSRAAAGLVVAALLAGAAGGSGPQATHLGAASRAHPAGDAAAIPMALDADGKQVPPQVGPPPDVKPADFKRQLEQRAERAAQVTPPAGRPTRDGGTEPAGPKSDPHTLLVTFDPGVSAAAAGSALAKGAVHGTRIADSRSWVVDTTGKSRADVTKALKQAPGVKAVEPNYIRTASKLPNDPEVPDQSGYLNAVAAPGAWDVANPGAAVTVAVLDTGADLDHPDLVPNLVAGYDIVNGDSSPMDDEGHGTETAGIIGAATNNGIGIAGVAWNAKIMPVKVLDAQGNGSDAEVATGIHWAVDHGAKIINMSLGGAGASQTLGDAVNYALDHDVVVVAAAGNESTQAPSYPAAYGGVLGVTATDDASHFAWFSNHGPWVMLAAPGVNVHTTKLGTGAQTTEGTGTSFSSPIVAGVAALLLERHPGWTWDTVAWQLIHTARDAGAGGVDDAYGFGVVDAAAALGASAIDPVSQPNLAGDAGNFPAAARVIPVGTPASETLAYSYDEDWFAFDVATPGGVTVTVTPPPALDAGFRAQEMDPLVEVYGPSGGRVKATDDGLVGEAEHTQFNAAAGTYRVHVTNYLGSTAPAPYTVTVQTGQPAFATFAAPTSLSAAGSVTTGPVVADVDGDGRADLVYANQTTLTVSKHNPDDTFTSTSHPLHGTSTGQPPIVGDIDGDGDVDLAVATTSGLDVSLQAGGALPDPTSYSGVTSLDVVRSARLDATPALEIVAGDGSSTDLRALRWNGSGFTSSALFTRPSGSRFVLGDVTGDGRADVVTYPPPTAGGAITVYAQAAGGTFSVAQTIDYSDILDGVASAAIGDVSHDGLADLVVGGDGFGDDPGLVVSVFQQPDHRLGAGRAMAVAPDARPTALRIGDVTGDDRADVVATLFDSGTNTGRVSVIRQTPAGHLATSEDTLGVPNGSADDVGLGDLDHDGLTDIAVGHPNGVLAVHQQHVSTPTPAGKQPWFTASSPAPNATGVAASVHPSVTFGRDLSPSSVNPNTVCLLSGRGAGCVPGTPSLNGHTVTVTPAKPLQPGAPYQLLVAGVADTTGSPVVANFPFTTAGAAAPTYNVASTGYWPFGVDLVGDGYDDVVWFTPTAAGDPIWFFGPEGKSDATAGVQGSFVPLAGDFDGNGFEDVFWYAPGSGQDVMWANGPGGIVNKPFTVNSTYVPVVGDFDRNGFDDIFWYGPGSTAESVWYFKAGGAHTSVAQPAVNGSGYRLAAGDFNKDGYDDVFWHLPGTGAEALWKGGPSGFSRVAAPAVNGTYNLRSGDFNGDGNDDLYWFNGSSASLWKVTTSGFASQAAPSVPGTARPVAADTNGDGRTDLLAYVPGSGADKLYPGKPSGL